MTRERKHVTAAPIGHSQKSVSGNRRSPAAMQVDSSSPVPLSAQNSAGGNTRVSSSAIKLKSDLKMGTWNVQSLYQSGKIHNTIKEMKRLEISILGISEMRWPGAGRCVVDDYTVYYSGEDTQYHRNGVAIIVSKEIMNSVTSVSPVSDRIIVIQINSKPVKLNIVQVYAPTTGSPDDEIEQFYEELNKVIKQLKSKDITIIMGDMNAKVGKGTDGRTVGEFGLGVRNDRGTLFVDFCKEKKLCIMNTFFKLPPRRLYTSTNR